MTATVAAKTLAFCTVLASVILKPRVRYGHQPVAGCIRNPHGPYARLQRRRFR